MMSPLPPGTLLDSSRTFVHVCSRTIIDGARELLSSERQWSGFLIDLNLGRRSGFELLDIARVLHPSTPALIVTGLAGRDLPNRALSLGALFLQKPVRREHLRRFVVEALACEAHLIGEVRSRLAASATAHRLSPAEVEILMLAIMNGEEDLIADIRGVSRNTHKTQVRSLLQKLGSTSLFAASVKILAPRGGGERGMVRGS
jgi:DNA-binding NarL/FixJ family response regulator